jgi:hypothetical protein
LVLPRFSLCSLLGQDSAALVRIRGNLASTPFHSLPTVAASRARSSPASSSPLPANLYSASLPGHKASALLRPWLPRCS